MDRRYDDAEPRIFKLFAKSALDIPPQPLVAIQTTLKRPHASLNPVVGSYEKQLFFKRVAGTGSANSISPIESGAYKLTLFDTLKIGLTSVRHSLSVVLDKVLLDYEHRGVMRALILGDRSQIPVHEFDLLSVSGTQHLLAISGLHVGIVMSMYFFMFGKGRRAFYVSSALGLVYIFLVGFGPSAQRAWVMMVIAFLSISGSAPVRPLRSLVIALFVVLLIDPLSTLSAGFWYSFFAVFVLLLVYWFKLGGKGWGALVPMQMVLFMALFPLNAFFVMPSSSIAVMANLIAIPLITFAVLPALLVCSLLLVVAPNISGVGYSLIDQILQMLFAYLTELDTLSQLRGVEANVLVLLGYWVCLLGLIVGWRFKRVSIMLVSLLVGLVIFPVKAPSSGSEFWVFDVGQGLAIAVRQDESIWMYDLGPATERSSAMKRVIIPFLRARFGQSEIDGLVVSHGDLDHAGGWEDFYRHFRARQVWVGEANRLKDGVFAQTCLQGMSWKSGSLSLEVLFPFSHFKANSSNNHSCVVRIELDGFVFLVMGDLEGEAEVEFVSHMLEFAPDKLKADVLIAGHHGAANASSYRLLKHVKPDYLVFSAGYRNRFNHPSDQVTARADNLDISTLNTADNGAIKFYSTSKKQSELSVVTMRELKNDYWLDQKASHWSRL